MPRKITEPQKERYWLLRNQGFSMSRASADADFSLATAKRLERQPSNGDEYREVRSAKHIPDTPTPLGDICDEAKAALADPTGYLFCLRYFGYELSPFQQSVWMELEAAWVTEDREYLCLNGPPGLGKTTVFVMFAAKRVVLWRAIRIMFMSRADGLAVKTTGRLKRALERVGPAVGAVTTLSADFGRFRPKQGGEVWKRNEYVVEQMDGEPIEEKESTVTAFGFESEWLGNRIDLLFGDDLDSTRSIRNMETVQLNRDIFDGELEPRLGERGLMVIGQQRLGAFDFSAHVLSKVILPEDDGSGEDVDGTPMYRHVIYKVHYEDRCQGIETHKAGAAAYPDGCLLDPRRMPWRDVRKAMVRADRYKVVYQQEDPGEEDALVQRIWVDGGRGPDGVVYLGCKDNDRGLWEIPKLDPPYFGVVTCDPSPTQFWSVQAWVYHPKSEQRFLIDLHRERMEAGDFLEWNVYDTAWTGIAEDWWHNFKRLGIPFTHLIFEKNTANRFITQTDSFDRWRRARGVNYIPHDTNRNKADPDYGVQMLAGPWKFGQVRLPMKQGGFGRVASMRLVDEVTRYPNVSTTDCLMGQWFLEHNLKMLTKRHREKKRVNADPRRPSWAA